VTAPLGDEVEPVALQRRDHLRDEQSLGTLESQTTDLGSFDLGDRIRGSVLEIELERLTQICERVVLAVAEARHVDVETLGHVVLAFVEDNGLNVSRGSFVDSKIVDALTPLLPFAPVSRLDRNSFATASSGCLVAVLVVLVPH
jgi:hypothetical protein